VESISHDLNRTYEISNSFYSYTDKMIKEVLDERTKAFKLHIQKQAEAHAFTQKIMGLLYKYGVAPWLHPILSFIIKNYLFPIYIKFLPIIDFFKKGISTIIELKKKYNFLFFKKLYKDIVEQVKK